MARRQTGPERRKAFHQGRIASAQTGVKRLWWTAWWLVAELTELDKRDKRRAHDQSLALANQLGQFADRLNNEHHDNLRGARRG
ncbi:hypothetical protein Aph01nite_08360 [Acrocarpospora phusangensis]|uniref:Uncharacterized protein n=1 Tax=Acrocarpospora phusangensis TaxID=1070424 RepID=A0A919Q5H5_9ACTN|nr:hypothetical protein [Acrocarpospora phusangensis]GIH22526.1 hypothetical protein Aph01nite_08360 [Acrocarpospora phusangensis]